MKSNVDLIKEWFKKADEDILTFYTPSLEEAKESYNLAIKVRDFVLGLLKEKL